MWGVRLVGSLFFYGAASLGVGESKMAQPFRVVVIGGVAAGCKVAAKAARLRPDAEVTLIEKGEHLSYAG